MLLLRPAGGGALRGGPGPDEAVLRVQGRAHDGTPGLVKHTHVSFKQRGLVPPVGHRPSVARLFGPIRAPISGLHCSALVRSDLRTLALSGP
eukprot:13431240-Alexandrium_andersonii.AAC.1